MSNTTESAQELFNQRVPAALAAHPDKAKEIGAIFQFKITGDGGGTWTVDLVSSPPTCLPGEKGTPQCTIEVAHEDFKSLLGNPALGMQLYIQGKLRIAGDPMLAMKMSKLLELRA
jgi:hypothetical protein